MHEKWKGASYTTFPVNKFSNKWLMPGNEDLSKQGITLRNVRVLCASIPLLLSRELCIRSSHCAQTVGNIICRAPVSMQGVLR